MTLSTERDQATGKWVILVTSHAHTSVAGHRILRGGVHPDIEWSHDTQAQAKAAKIKLHTYLESLPSRKTSKTALRRFVA